MSTYDLSTPIALKFQPAKASRSGGNKIALIKNSYQAYLTPPMDVPFGVDDKNSMIKFMGQCCSTQPFVEYLAKLSEAAVDAVHAKHQLSFFGAEGMSRDEVAARYFNPSFDRANYGAGISFATNDKTKWFKLDAAGKKVAATADDLAKKSKVRVVAMIGPAWISGSKWGLKVRAEAVMIDSIGDPADDDSDFDADAVFA
jgi:hypothetical protein